LVPNAYRLKLNACGLHPGTQAQILSVDLTPRKLRQHAQHPLGWGSMPKPTCLAPCRLQRYAQVNVPGVHLVSKWALAMFLSLRTYLNVFGLNACPSPC